MQFPTKRYTIYIIIFFKIHNKLYTIEEKNAY